MKLDRQYSQLDYKERETIAIARQQGLSIREIARILKRSASTISRELSRNAGGAAYSCKFAQQRVVKTRRYSRPPPKLMPGNALFDAVRALLARRWSPQRIAAHLAKLHPHETTKRVSHETIYNVSQCG